MPWNTLTVEDVEAEILPSEVAVLNTVQGSDAILATILATCLAEIQARILVGGNQIDTATTTVPDQIRSDCIAYVRWKWFCSLPKTDLQSDFRKSQFDTAEEKLKAIEVGKPKVEIPANPRSVAGPSFRVEISRPGNRPQDYNKTFET